MVKLKKIKLCNEELGLQIGKHTLSIKRFFDLVILAAILVFAYNVGVHDAQEMIKYTAYISEYGICNSSGCYKCYPSLSKNHVIWACTNKTLLNIDTSK